MRVHIYVFGGNIIPLGLTGQLTQIYYCSYEIYSPITLSQQKSSLESHEKEKAKANKPDIHLLVFKAVELLPKDHESMELQNKLGGGQYLFPAFSISCWIFLFLSRR